MIGQRSQMRTGVIHSLMTAMTVEGFTSGERDQVVKKVRDSLDWVVTGDPIIVRKSKKEENKEDKKEEKVWAAFSQGGDSGALVYTNDNPQNRVLVGMVRAGLTPWPYCTLVTPIEFIFKDIKTRTGVEAIRLKV